jgi:hypothetical protein
VQYVGGVEVGAKNEALFPGRVPHVRPSVHGPKKTGAAPSSASVTWGKNCGRGQESSCNEVKALETIRFRPMYVQANMGHPSRAIGSGYLEVWPSLAQDAKFRVELEVTAGAAEKYRPD